MSAARCLAIGRVAFLASCIAGLGISSPYAATIESKTIDQEGQSLTLIFVEGKLILGDEKEFVDAAIGAERAMVLFSSPGGNLYAGIEIGKVISFS